MPMPMYRPPYTVDFGTSTEVRTSEVLEELGISYDTLASRQSQNGFPKPISNARKGKTAVYDRDEIDAWLTGHGFRVKCREKR